QQPLIEFCIFHASPLSDRPKKTHTKPGSAGFVIVEVKEYIGGARHRGFVLSRLRGCAVRRLRGCAVWRLRGCAVWRLRGCAVWRLRGFGRDRSRGRVRLNSR
ncbi:MAG: hypothetical protein JXB04_01055, partial [Kiritimatiellae bacterium]|nr:hypothetical protein [Kiritimatiellia bacterium]